MASRANVTQPALARKRENWGSKLGVILAVAGSAVGLGNFLRFPGQAAMNGGGIFMIPYFISLLILGIPICWVEWTMGRYGGTKGFNSSPGIFSVLWNNRLSKYFGALALIVPVGIYMYYVYIEAWCLAYAWDYLSGRMSRMPQDVDAYKTHFGNFVGESSNGFLLRGTLQESVIFLLIVFVINFVFIYRGLTKGIEVFVKFAMPVLILFALVVLVRVLTLGTPEPPQPGGSINDGLGFMWNPRVVTSSGWEQTGGPEVEVKPAESAGATFVVPEASPGTELTFKGVVRGGLEHAEKDIVVMVGPGAAPPTRADVLSASAGDEVWLGFDGPVIERIEAQPAWTALFNPQLWLAAAGQIFFSLSVGFGIILNYASYLRRDDDVVLSGLTATSTNEFCEVCLGGLITLPVAFVFLGPANLGPDVISSGFKLGFIALPAVFARMPIGDFFGAVWFFMLFAAAITSSLSMLQPAIAFLEEGFAMGRRLSVTCLSMLTATGSLLVVYFSKNLLALDVMDFWIGTVCIFILATIQVITVGWLFGTKRAAEEAKRGAQMRIPNVVWFVIKYVSPVYLLVIFGMWCYYNVPAQIENIGKMQDEDRGTVLLMLSFIGVLLIFFGLLVNLAGKRWRMQGRLPADRKTQSDRVSGAGI